MPCVDLSDVAVPLPAVVRELHGSQASPIATSSDGACSIHSVWGDAVNGELFKPNARSFLREAFGPNAGHFAAKVASDELIAEIEIAVWEMIAPIAKQSILGNEAPEANDHEGKLLWNSILASSAEVAQRCCDACETDMLNFQIYRESKEDVMKRFSSLCTEAYRDSFIQPLMESMGLLEKYREELSGAFHAGRRLSKYELLFADSGDAQALQRTVVEEACLNHTFDLLLSKINDVINGLPLNGSMEMEAIMSFAQSSMQS